MLKAEILITRRCNLQCRHCKITPNGCQELSLDEWFRVFDIVYRKLGAAFIAIYGGEPMQLGQDNLCKIVKELSRYRPQKSYTIISNSIGLTDGYMISLMQNGLDSWTASVDTLDSSKEIDKYTLAKTSAGLTALLKFKEMGLRDCCGIITVNHQNISCVVDTVEFLSQHNIWTGLDLIHFRKGAGQSGLPLRSAVKDLILTNDDLPLLTDVASKLIEMKQNGALIFPTYKTLQAWSDPNYSIHLNWKCGQIEPICISIDADGSLRECDSFKGSRMNFSIFDLPKKWSSFSRDYMDDVAFECLGCFWSTHFFAEEVLENIEYYQHEKTYSL